jgi:hypothetical protein
LERKKVKTDKIQKVENPEQENEKIEEKIEWARKDESKRERNYIKRKEKDGMKFKKE